MKKITESDSHYDYLHNMSVSDLLLSINIEDNTIAASVAKKIFQIEPLVNAIVAKLKKGGRLFYLGAGTSGRLGVLDASECPPTFGIDHGLVVGLIAGGDIALRKSVEHSEDNIKLGWQDLKSHNVSSLDLVVGIAASGTTPYVLGALKKCQKENITSGCIVCNYSSPISALADYPVEVVVGPEFITGSTRMKSGTAQKLVLNMISSSVMIKLGKIKGNKMIDMQLSNTKLVDRGINMIMNETGVTYEAANLLLEKYGNVRQVIQNYNG